MRKKKWLNVLVVCTIFLGVLQGVVFAEEIEPNIVAHYTFDSGKEGWTVFGASDSEMTREPYSGNSRDYYLAINNHCDSWVSPMINLYSLIKENGPGTYTAHASVRTSSDKANLEVRMIMRSYKGYSFITNINGNFHAGIGTPTQIYQNEWTDLSGSFKVLPEDIQNETGYFFLCFDYLEDGWGSQFCVDEVIICKLNDTDITNGSFSYDTIGWRNWGGYGTLYRAYVREADDSIFSMGYYLKSSVYGSIACNVDQILSYYGATEYEVNFDLYLTQEAHAYLSKMVFYLSTNDGQSNVFIGQRSNASLTGDGRTHVTLTVDTTDLAPESSQTIYNFFSPHSNQVFFRMEYQPKFSTGIIADEEYGISNVSFRPKNSASFVPSQYTVITNSFLEITPGESFQLNATVYPANSTYQHVTWHSSDTYYLTVDSTGRITAAMYPGAGEQTVTITARAGDGLSQTTCTVTIKDLQFKYLKEKFGFDTRVCNILEDIQNALKIKYSTDLAHADYMYNRIVGGFDYLGWDWNLAAGNPYSGTDEERYITEELGISSADYKYVRYHVRLQHTLTSDPIKWNLEAIKERAKNDPTDYNNCITKYRAAINSNATEQEFELAWEEIYNRYYNKGDFSHQSYTTSALLYDGVVDEDRKDLAGWLGDVALPDDGIPSFGADDYYADLDSENIVYFMNLNDWSYNRAFKDYYAKVGSVYKRAEIFLRHTNISTVKRKAANIISVTQETIEHALENDEKRVIACYNLITNLRNNNNEFVDEYRRAIEN